MSSLEGLRPGDRIVVPEGKEGYERRTVARIDGCWLIDDQDRRYWISSGKSEWHNVTSRFALTEAAFTRAEVVRELHDVLRVWGLQVTPVSRLTDDQLRQITVLLRGFKQEG